MPMYEIWSEGYAVTGGDSDAFLLGSATGSNFKEACITLVKSKPHMKECFNADYLTYWGCKLFDNEKDARKSFG